MISVPMVSQGEGTAAGPSDHFAVGIGVPVGEKWAKTREEELFGRPAP